MNRCLNNLFGYCDGTPQIIDTPGYIISYNVRGKEHITPAPWERCHLNHAK